MGRGAGTLETVAGAAARGLLGLFGLHELRRRLQLGISRSAGVRGLGGRPVGQGCAHVGPLQARKPPHHRRGDQQVGTFHPETYLLIASIIFRLD